MDRSKLQKQSIDSMFSIMLNSYPLAVVAVDKFHVIRYVYDAVQSVLLTYKQRVI